MIRRVLKDVRETWPYWVGLIALLLVPIAAGWIYVGFQGPFGGSHAPRPKPDPAALAKAYRNFREGWHTILLYLALIHYLAFLLISVSLFGAEFKHQTMARLLAQPISRRRIWFEKSLAYLFIVSVVLICEWLIYGKSFLGVVRMDQMAISKQDIFVSPWYPVTSWVLCLLSVAALALATGTLTSLFLRQTHTAFWAALVLPVLVLAGATLILNLVFGFSVFDWIQDWFYFRSNLTSIDLFLFDVGAALWFAFVYPLAWLKFKKLEV